MNNDLLQEFSLESQRIEEDSIHSSKGHYNAASRWSSVNLWMGIPNAVLAGIAGISAFNEASLFAGVLAISVAAISAVLTFLNPSERASTHKICGGEYLSLRNRARVFSNITSKYDNAEKKIQDSFEELVAKRDNLNSTSPQIPEWAFKKAKAGIDAGESTYKS